MNNTLSLGQVTTMVALQDTLNKTVNKDWLTANYPWYRAAMVEGVELLEHVGWKWWKHQEPNLVQAQIELVDIWHFAVSVLIEMREGSIEQAAESIYSGITNPEPLPKIPLDLKTTIDTFVADAADHTINFDTFVKLMGLLDLSWPRLYQLYVAKNVLNMFRQANGYKDGSYHKTWGGAEDNVHLAALMEYHPDASPEDLMHFLSQSYQYAANDLQLEACPTPS